MSELHIKKIVNSPIDSNCYVAYRKDSKKCFIVDPGSANSGLIHDFLKAAGLNPLYILLTHEHFDHIWGVNDLKDVYGSKIICSEACSNAIIHKKKNMSIFYDQVGFESYPADYTIESIDNKLEGDFSIHFLITEGHTPGSICFLADGNLFTGDTIIPGIKTVTKFPGGNREKLFCSVELLISQFGERTRIIYPGHGNPTTFEKSLVTTVI
jgi:glyoxylase-like metal-dependent hydrolase (beta-lactamase superfamily II)